MKAMNCYDKIQAGDRVCQDPCDGPFGYVLAATELWLIVEIEDGLEEVPWDREQSQLAPE